MTGAEKNESRGLIAAIVCGVMSVASIVATVVTERPWIVVAAAVFAVMAIAFAVARFSTVHAGWWTAAGLTAAGGMAALFLALLSARVSLSLLGGGLILAAGVMALWVVRRGPKRAAR